MTRGKETACPIPAWRRIRNISSVPSGCRVRVSYVVLRLRRRGVRYCPGYCPCCFTPPAASSCGESFLNNVCCPNHKESPEHGEKDTGKRVKPRIHCFRYLSLQEPAFHFISLARRYRRPPLFTILALDGETVSTEQARLSDDVEAVCSRLVAAGLPSYFAEYPRMGGAVPAPDSE